MGVAYRKNIKNQYGKPDVTARDVLTLGVNGLTGDGAMENRGITDWPATRETRLEGASVVLSSGVTAGSIGIALKADGLTIASGDITSGAHLDLLLDKESLEQVIIDEGTVVKLIYSAQGLGSTVDASARVHQSLLE